MCLPWWALVISFLLGAASMLAFWLLLARIAMGGIVVPGGKGDDDGGDGRI